MTQAENQDADRQAKIETIRKSFERKCLRPFVNRDNQDKAQKKRKEII